MTKESKPLTDEERRYYRTLLREEMAADPLGTRRFPREPQGPKLSRIEEARLLLNECRVALALDEVGKIRPDANTDLLARINKFLGTGGI